MPSTRTKRPAAAGQSRRFERHPSSSKTGEPRTVIAKRSSAIVERDRESVELLKRCLEHAMKAERFTLRQTARSMYISASTLSLWLNDSMPIDVVAVRRSKRLWPHFVIHLLHRESVGGHLG
jgi:hypothetical protein